MVTHTDTQLSSPSRRATGPTWMLPAVAILAMAVQLVFVLESHRSVVFQLPLVDAASYWNQAAALAQGQPPAAKPFWQPPLYVYSLATLMSWGLDDPLAVRLMHGLIGALIASLTFVVARRVAAPRVAWVAALAVTFSGPLLFFSTQLLPTGPATALNMLGLWCWLRVTRRPAWPWALATGLVLGLAALLVSNILIVLPVLVGWLAWRIASGDNRPRWIEATVALGVGLVLVLLPVTIRNYAVSGQRVLISTNGGINLYIGNNPEAARTIAIRPGVHWQRLVAWPYQAGAGNDAEAEAFFLREVWRYARQQPGAFVGGMADKALHVLNGREIPRNVDLYTFRPHSAMLARLTWKAGSFAFPLGLVMPLALWGLMGAWRAGGGQRILAAYALMYGASIILFFPASRYMMPMLPVLIILAALGGARLLRAAAPARERVTGLVSVCLLGILLNLPVWLPTDAINFASDLESNVGVGLQARGRTDEAVAHYRAAIELDPGHADAFRFLGTAHRAQGRRTAARWHLQQAVRLNPDHADALQDLAIMAFEDGHTQDAVDLLGRVLALTPDNRHAMVNLGIGFTKLGREAEARTWFTQAGVMGPAGLDLEKLKAFQR